MKKILLFSVKAGVSVGVLLIILKKVGLPNILQVMLSIPPWSVLGSIGLFLVSLVFSSLRWRLFIASRPGIPRLFSLFLVGSFFNTLLPGIIGGDAVRAYYLHKDTSNINESIASIFFERYLGYSILMILGMIAYPYALINMGMTPLAWIFPAVGASFLLASFALFRWKLGARLKILAGFFHLLENYVQDRRSILLGLLYSVVVQTLIILSVWILSVGLGHKLHLILFFAFLPIIVMVSTLPISISGLGIREFSFIVLFGSAGLAPETATALSLAWFISQVLAALIGLVEFVRTKVR